MKSIFHQFYGPIIIKISEGDNLNEKDGFLMIWVGLITLPKVSVCIEHFRSGGSCFMGWPLQLVSQSARKALNSCTKVLQGVFKNFSFCANFTLKCHHFSNNVKVTVILNTRQKNWKFFCFHWVYTDYYTFIALPNHPVC